MAGFVDALLVKTVLHACLQLLTVSRVGGWAMVIAVKESATMEPVTAELAETATLEVSVRCAIEYSSENHLAIFLSRLLLQREHPNL
jgi:hypothetical protein